MVQHDHMSEHFSKLPDRLKELWRQSYRKWDQMGYGDATCFREAWFAVALEVIAVEGCDCGGLDMHRTDCSLWELSYDERVANTEAAKDELDEWTTALADKTPLWNGRALWCVLNERLRAARLAAYAEEEN